MELKEDQQRQSEWAEALLDLLQTTESPEPTQPPSDSPQPEDTSGILNDQQDAGCQTDLTMEDIERMEDVLRQNTTELGDLRTKALDTKFNQESFENNEEKTTFYTGLPNFLVLLQGEKSAVSIRGGRDKSIEHMLTKPGEALALIDKIGVICCALSNLSVSVVPLE
ncbi:hypothetical protein JOQ06_022337 [Pogonophryne albipinna]|uniref:Uncharacterized protein n=1 Tax=Pogonophryne albipinna TaxID=1090488 RepID=A0AAD6A7Y1_9TELE|nr:hypothetical protein JOQ06_022337 [Pogonophryne albipinna]